MSTDVRISTPAPTARRSERRMSRLPHRPWVPPTPPSGFGVTVGSVAALVGAVLLWLFASTRTFVIPAPVETFRILWRDVTDPDQTANYTVTAVEIGSSILIGTAIGTFVGVVMGLSVLVRTVLQSFISAMYALPKIVLYPLLIPLLGIGSGSKIAVGFIFCVFPIVLIVAAATASMPPVYRKLATSVRLRPHQFLTKIVLPITLRALVTGVRVGLSLAVLGVILSEFVASQRGIGRQMHRYYELAQYDGLFATVLALLLITFVASWVLWRVEKAFEWR